MKYEKKFDVVKDKLKEATHEALDNVGKFGTAEEQLRTPVDTGELRRSEGYNVAENSVAIGANTNYAEIVHNGDSRQKAQPFLKDAIMENIDEINRIVQESLSRVGD